MADGWPRIAPKPEPGDTVQVLMSEELARRFEAWLELSTIGRCKLAPALLFSEDDLPSYIITPGRDGG